MNIQILQLTEGAKKAIGLTVIIDVFRAFTTACFMINNNAEAIYPVGSVEEAFSLKSRIPNSLIAGERNEVIVPGFDFGNSPANIEHTDLTGKKIIHTTSAGTQGIVNAVNADEIITAAFVNVYAVVRYIKKSSPNDVSIVCMGKAAKSPAEEDMWCAEYIRALLLGENYDIENRLIRLRDLEGRRFFNPDNQEQCPQRDFFLSTRLGIFNFVLKAETDKAGLIRLIRKDI